ncbi:MAG: hypothetical protein HZA91_14235 [Verrucomicrobia bacterium]|nr:hypothetical protein [Verrucomicrobiota bacterium]
MTALLHIALFAAASSTNVIQVYEPISGLTEPPITYVLDYGSNHVGNAEWLAQVAAAPPTLLHLGKDVPMTHSWGPVRALGGENQAFGKGDAITLLKPAEVGKRMTNITGMVRALHAAGVKMVMPYVCSMTLAGHDQKRTGFWAFYDQWVKYAAGCDLGLRPAPDPVKWLQRQPDGSVQRFYKYDGDFYPAYEPNHRYAACANNPNWQHWLSRVVSLAAKCGYDGVFTDNGASQRCYCAECQKEFRTWATHRKLAHTDLMRAAPEDAGRYEQAQRFWLESMHRLQLRLRTAAMKHNPDFKIFANGGHNRPEAVKLAFADSNFVMFEKSVGERGTHPGLAGGRVNHNVVELKYVQCLRKMVKPVILTRSGYPKSQPEFEMNRASAALGCAEMAAFGNGGGFLIRPNWPDGAAVVKQYRAFYERNADLYRTNDSFTPVAVAFWGEQKLAGNKKHAEVVRQVSDQLLASRVAFDYVVEDCFTNNFIRRYPALVLPEIAHAGPKWLETAASYVQQGGNVMIVGAHPENSPLLPMIKTRSPGRGLVSRLDSLDEPTAIPSWLNDYVHVSAQLLADDGREELQRVFVNCFARRSRETGDIRVAIHLVNYNVPLGANAPPPAPLGDLMVRLPVLPNLKLRGLTALDPDSPDAEKLEWKQGESGLWVKLPRLAIYKIVVVDFASTVPPPPPVPKSQVF